MRCIYLVVLLAGCEGKRSAPPPAPAPAPARAATRARSPQPSLPVADKRVTYRLPSQAVIWSFAESSNTAAAWESAAAVFEDQLAGCEHDCGETAYAVLLARKNALRVEPIAPPPGDEPIAELPPRVQAALDATDQYVALGDPSDPDVKGARFLAASLTWKWRQNDDAIERLTTILRFHRDHPTAEYAANQLLELLSRLNRTDELRKWVAELTADTAFLADKPELRATLEQLRVALAAN